MITINMPKAKEIAHGIRRENRAAEFSPLDEIIAKQIPGNSFADAEAQRAAIRQKYDLVQHNIDNAEAPEELKIIIA